MTAPNRSEALSVREYVDRYHSLGYTPLPAAQLRYLWPPAKHQIPAALGFAACAWKVPPRDRFIGWSPQQRQAHLHLAINNARLLILPPRAV